MITLYHSNDYCNVYSTCQPSYNSPYLTLNLKTSLSPVVSTTSLPYPLCLIIYPLCLFSTQFTLSYDYFYLSTSSVYLFFRLHCCLSTSSPRGLALLRSQLPFFTSTPTCLTITFSPLSPPSLSFLICHLSLMRSKYLDGFPSNRYTFSLQSSRSGD